MTTLPEKKPYDKVREVLKSIGGDMFYRPGGGPGGAWVLELWGKTTEVEVRAIPSPIMGWRKAEKLDE